MRYPTGELSLLLIYGNVIAPEFNRFPDWRNGKDGSLVTYTLKDIWIVKRWYLYVSLSNQVLNSVTKIESKW